MDDKRNGGDWGEKLNVSIVYETESGYFATFVTGDSYHRSTWE